MRDLVKKDGVIGREIGPLEALLAWIVSVSITAVFLLVLSIFHAAYALVAGTILFLLIGIIFNFRIDVERKKFDGVLLLILLIALFFRIGPYLYIMGGQDEGVYVNMSSYYEKAGGTFIRDNIRANMPRALRPIYDDSNQYKRRMVKPGKYEGSHLPGIYIEDLRNSEYEFQFYPLHPLWMAIFGKLFGATNRVYSLVFFSLLSIWLFYLLALELSGGKKLPAYLLALFIAVNPLHAFFSKFPVTEIVSLFFSSAGFYLLVKYYEESKEGNTNVFYLILSSGSFLCLFLNHIAGFLYLPLFYFILLLAMLYVDNRAVKRSLIVYCLSIFAGFGLSLLYGYNYSFPYFYDVYRLTFGAYLGPNFHVFLLMFVLLAAMIAIMVFFNARRLKPYLERLSPLIYKFYPAIIYGIILLAFFHALQLGFTDKYEAARFNQRWHIADKGVISLAYSSIVVAVSYLTPFGFLLFLAALNCMRKVSNIKILTLIIFLSVVWFMRIILAPVIPYQYYYARYLLGEVVPYSFLLIAIYVGQAIEKDRIHKIVIGLLCICVLVFSVYFTSFQLLGRVAKGADKALSGVAGRMDGNDILLINAEGFAHYNELVTPLSYYYGLNTITVPDALNVSTNIAAYLSARYGDLFVLSQEPLGQYTLVDTIPYKQGFFEPYAMIPRRFYYFRKTLYLYKITRKINFSKEILPSEFDIGNFYDNIWTNGDGVIKRISYKIMPQDKYLVLKTRGWNPYMDNLKRLKLKIFVDGEELKFVTHRGSSYYFELDGNVREINNIKIQSSTFVPKSLGINGDDRALGIDVDSIVISE
jgi:hypothetical protein